MACTAATNSSWLPNALMCCTGVPRELNGGIDDGLVGVELGIPFRENRGVVIVIVKAAARTCVPLL